MLIMNDCFQAFYGPRFAVPPPYMNSPVASPHAPPPYMWGPPQVLPICFRQRLEWADFLCA